MSRRVSAVLKEQHVQLREQLTQCLSTSPLDVARFDEFRHRLLWHVSVEERVVMPAIIRARGGAPLGSTGLRKDHAGIAALCVPKPEREWVENLRDLLDEHYRVEEGEGGFLSWCDDALGGADEARVVADLEAHPPLTLAPFRRGPSVRAQVTALLKLVGVAP